MPYTRKRRYDAEEMRYIRSCTRGTTPSNVLVSTKETSEIFKNTDRKVRYKVLHPHMQQIPVVRRMRRGYVSYHKDTKYSRSFIVRNSVTGQILRLLSKAVNVPSYLHRVD